MEHKTVLQDVTDMFRIHGFTFGIVYYMKKFFYFEKINNLHSVNNLQRQKSRPSSSQSQIAFYFERCFFFLFTVGI